MKKVEWFMYGSITYLFGNENKMIYNTTNIPNKLVEIAMAFSMPVGVEISSISLRNKIAGKLSGNWGRYYAADKSITLCIPNVIDKFPTKLRHYGLYYTLASRSEFIVSVIAHELRHAWQFQISGWSKDALQSVSNIEWDAEKYEYEQLEKWRLFVGKEDNIIAARNG